MDVFKITRTIATSYSALPYRVANAFEDPFAQDLIRLWEEKKRRGQVYVAYLYSVPVGFCLVEQEGLAKKATIRGMYVQKSFRGKEVGRFLLNSVIQDFGMKDIWVNISNGAQGFYEKFGFEIVGERADLPKEAGSQFVACRAPEGLKAEDCIAAAKLPKEMFR